MLTSMTGKTRTTKPKPAVPLTSAEIASFRKKLGSWYSRHARDLPWRGGVEPYRTWVSEIMLQQTRVAAVLEHYFRFLELFPTIFALALAEEDAVLAAWSGLGYYRRARLLHRAAKSLVKEHNGEIPHTAVELRRLPGIGDYTAAAIASIAFAEQVAVVDGNVERVLLRVTGRAEDKSTASRVLSVTTAQALVPKRQPGDHNQAMMELGATVCLPKGPLCTVCPVYELCLTRGEHTTGPRQKMLSSVVYYGLIQRHHREADQVLLQKRHSSESLMPDMWELPTLEGPPEGLQPALRVRHSITNTNYYVEIYKVDAASPLLQNRTLGLTWKQDDMLQSLALTGLARKVLERSGVLDPAIKIAALAAE